MANSTGVAASSACFLELCVRKVQVCDGLPSLHTLARKDAEGIVSNDRFDTVFVPFQDVDKVGYKGLKGISSGDLLLSFFDFFADKFDWKREVVSVREASRQTIESPCFQNLWGRTKKAGLHVEDPIDALRNTTVVSIIVAHAASDVTWWPVYRGDFGELRNWEGTSTIP